MTALCGWCTSPSATAIPPFPSRQAQLESGVRGNVPAPFGAAIPHREPDLDEFSAIKPHIPLAQELEQVQMLVGQFENRESLPRDVEHINPHKEMKTQAWG